jgi:hypothetical protein
MGAGRRAARGMLEFMGITATEAAPDLVGAEKE